MPPGATWIRGQDARIAARGFVSRPARTFRSFLPTPDPRRRRVDAYAPLTQTAAPVLVGFERKRGAAPRPKHDGVLVRDADVPVVLEKLRAARGEAAAAKRADKGRRIAARWGALARAALSREKLRQTYGA